LLLLLLMARQLFKTDDAARNTTSLRLSVMIMFQPYTHPSSSLYSVPTALSLALSLSLCIPFAIYPNSPPFSGFTFPCFACQTLNLLTLQFCKYVSLCVCVCVCVCVCFSLNLGWHPLTLVLSRSHTK
jgi:hypothetical protein